MLFLPLFFPRSARHFILHPWWSQSIHFYDMEQYLMIYASGLSLGPFISMDQSLYPLGLCWGAALV